MDTEQEAAMEDEQLRRRMIGVRARKRDLESREFKLQSLVSGVYVYSAFQLCMAAVGFIFLGGRAFIGAVICVVVAAGFGYAIYRLWRRSNAPIWLLALPCVVFLLLSFLVGGWRGYLFWFNVAALFALWFLLRTWRQYASLPNYSFNATAQS
jgi:hypothetical protein